MSYFKNKHAFEFVLHNIDRLTIRSIALPSKVITNTETRKGPEVKYQIHVRSADDPSELRWYVDTDGILVPIWFDYRLSEMEIGDEVVYNNFAMTKTIATAIDKITQEHLVMHKLNEGV